MMGSIGLNCYHMSQPGGEAVVVGCTSLGWPVGGWGRSWVTHPWCSRAACMTVVALSLILQYVVHSWSCILQYMYVLVLHSSKLKVRGGGGKVYYHWQERASLNWREMWMVEGLYYIEPRWWWCPSFWCMMPCGCENTTRAWRYLLLWRWELMDKVLNHKIIF